MGHSVYRYTAGLQYTLYVNYDYTSFTFMAWSVIALSMNSTQNSDCILAELPLIDSVLGGIFKAQNQTTSGKRECSLFSFSFFSLPNTEG